MASLGKVLVFPFDDEGLDEEEVGIFAIRDLLRDDSSSRSSLPSSALEVKDCKVRKVQAKTATHNRLLL